VFWLFTVLAIITMVALQLLGRPLKTAPSPAGIVSYELAGTLEDAHAILESWDAHARVYAGINLGLDYLFIDAYVGAIGLGCVVVGRRLRGAPKGLGSAGAFLAWAMVLAGVLDVVENYALIRLLLGSQAALLPTLARLCAIPKFLIVLISLIYVLVGALASLLIFRSRRGESAA